MERILSENKEPLGWRYDLKAKGLTVYDVADHVGKQLGIDTESVWQPGKFRQQVIARSLLWYWAVQELGESMTGLGSLLNISTVAVSKSVRRGAQISKAEKLKFIS